MYFRAFFSEVGSLQIVRLGVGAARFLPPPPPCGTTKSATDFFQSACACHQREFFKGQPTACSPTKDN